MFLSMIGLVACIIVVAVAIAIVKQRQSPKAVAAREERRTQRAKDRLERLKLEKEISNIDETTRTEGHWSMRWFVLLIWILALTILALTNYFPYWKWIVGAAAVAITLLLAFGSPYVVPKKDDEWGEKKQRPRGSFWGEFIGGIIVVLITIIIAAVAGWVVITVLRDTFPPGWQQQRQKPEMAMPFPSQIIVPYSTDPNGAYSEPIRIGDGDNVRFDWANFPKDVYVDICWTTTRGKEVTRMFPVNHPRWREPWGENILAMEFKAVTPPPKGVTEIILGYNLKQQRPR